MLGGLKDIASVIGRGRFPLTRESDLQHEMDLALRLTFPGVEISREHRLGPADRPDWLIDGRFVVEAKIRGAGRKLIVGQLNRYAVHPCVEGIVLATGKSMPPIVTRVPVVIVNLGRAWL